MRTPDKKTTTWIRAVQATCVCLGVSAVACRNGAPNQADLEVMRVGGIPIHVEIADTPETRRLGLMYRDDLPPDQGMLFVYSKDEVLTFWMKNTRVPLSIAFISKDARIVRIIDMHPFGEESHSSGVPVRFALEMSQGWFREHGIEPGNRVELPGRLKPTPSSTP